jgi:ribose-phosphate pyrophosphokinase
MIKINGNLISFEEFSNGETRLNADWSKYVDYGYNEIFLKYDNDSDLIHLMFVKKHLDLISNGKSELIINYMPYSRQDRVEDYYVFTLKYVTEFINKLHFDYVEIAEPHSDVVVALLDRCSVNNATVKIFDSIDKPKDASWLFYPDAGAQKRYAKQIKSYTTLIGNKNRDFRTGKITDYAIGGNTASLMPYDTIYILDDLCSYGGTFLLAAKELHKIYDTLTINLVVAHAENAMLEGEMISSDEIDHIYTTCSILDIDKLKQSKYNEKVTIVEINEEEILK